MAMTILYENSFMATLRGDSSMALSREFIYDEFRELVNDGCTREFVSSCSAVRPATRPAARPAARRPGGPAPRPALVNYA